MDWRRNSSAQSGRGHQRFCYGAVDRPSIIFIRSKRNPAVYSPKFRYLASTMAKQLKVMISSTARDLPEHRQKVMDACMHLGMFYPDMMENLNATDANALEVSLRIVDRADLYVGVFAFRYGY